MTGQQLFNLYSYVIVGFMGNAIIGWQLGKKGFLRIGLEGPRNRPVRLALFGFIAMLVWARVAKISPPFQHLRDAWPPIVGVSALALARALTPRSQRLYDRAKFLMETANVGDWRTLRAESDILAAQNHPRLIEAERLYVESVAVQERLIREGKDLRTIAGHKRNVVIAQCQLSLLYMMQGRLAQAHQRALTAVSSADELREYDDGRETQASLSMALFRAGQAEHLLGLDDAAVLHLERALKIDTNLGDLQGAEQTRQLLGYLTGASR